ncbi:MAG: DUF484 family protein [Sphingomicrobium sp.]
MGQVIGFEERAVARLRDRLGAVESARADLAAFARDHSGAVATIHAAVLAVMDARNLDELIAVVTRDWPAILGVESVALAFVVGGRAFRADAVGVGEFSRAVIDRTIANLGAVTLRTVERGHPLFADSAGAIRAESLIRFETHAPMPYGLLAIGQHDTPQIEQGQSSDLLLFLAATLASMMRRCVIEGMTTA